MTTRDDVRSDDVIDFDDLLADPAIAEAAQDAEQRTALRATLIARRKAVGLTQAQVARLMESTQSSISEFESGAGDPHLSTLQRYARAVGARVIVRAELLPR